MLADQGLLVGADDGGVGGQEGLNVGSASRGVLASPEADVATSGRTVGVEQWADGKFLNDQYLTLGPSGSGGIRSRPQRALLVVRAAADDPRSSTVVAPVVWVTFCLAMTTR